VSRQLGSHDVFGRRICSGRDSRQSDLHHRRWSLLAFEECGEKFRGAKIANLESARTGFGAGIAHHPHQRRRVASLLAYAGIRPQKEGHEVASAAFHGQRPKGYTERADSFGLNLKMPLEQGKLEILYLRPLDLSVDETMQEILDAVERIG